MDGSFDVDAVWSTKEALMRWSREDEGAFLVGERVDDEIRDVKYSDLEDEGESISTAKRRTEVYKQC